MEENNEKKEEVKGFNRWIQRKDPLFRATKEEFDKVTKVPYIVKDILAENSMAALSGLPESYKSWVSLHLGNCVASGLPFLGKFEIQKKGNVLYLLFEGSSNVIRFRMKKLISDSNPNLAVLPSMGYYFNVNQIEGEVKAVLEMQAMESFAEKIKKTCIEENVVLIIVDTLRESYNGDENSSKDITTVLNKLRSIMNECGCSVWAITHIGKIDNKKINYEDMYHLIRGSSALSGAFDYVYGLKVDEDKSSRPGEIALVLYQAKNRNEAKIRNINIMMIEGENNKIGFTAEYDTTLTPKQKLAREEILSKLNANKEGTGFSELVKGSKTVGRSTKVDQLKEMEKENEVTQDKTTGKYMLKDSVSQNNS